ncbi:hypothetical protein MTO96_046129 [Rhipicephalus appendiculatus]
MENSLPDPASGFALSAARSRQMEMLLKDASRIIGKQCSTTEKHLSPKRISSARKVRTTSRPGSTKAGTIKKKKKWVSPPPPDVEEVTQEATPSTRIDNATADAGQENVTFYFRSPSRPAATDTNTPTPTTGLASAHAETEPSSAGDTENGALSSPEHPISRSCSSELFYLARISIQAGVQCECFPDEGVREGFLPTQQKQQRLNRREVPARMNLYHIKRRLLARASDAEATRPAFYLDRTHFPA